jgi:hypothetical protein
MTDFDTCGVHDSGGSINRFFAKNVMYIDQVIASHLENSSEIEHWIGTFTLSQLFCVLSLALSISLSLLFTTLHDEFLFVLLSFSCKCSHVNLVNITDSTSKDSQDLRQLPAGPIPSPAISTFPRVF